MAITLSTSHANAQGMGCSLQELYTGGELQIFTGTPPSVDAAYTGTLLVACTLAGAARTAEIQATAIIELTGGAAGSVDNITIGGYEVLGAAVTFNSSLTQTAADVASQINKYAGAAIKIWATSSAAIITLRACPGQGTALNGKAIVCSCTTITNAINGGSADNMGEGAGGSTAGVAAASGLTWGEIAAGVLTKTGTISGTPGATGAAGYYRVEGCNTPTGTSVADVPTSTPRYRIQGTCGLSGADMIFNGTTTITASVSHTVTNLALTIPRS